MHFNHIRNLFSTVFFFFFMQKTAYKLRFSDWSSDVCSSDLPDARLVETRGDGLLIGLDLCEDKSAEVVAAGFAAGFILSNPTPNRIRLAPPLVLTTDEAAALIDAWPGILDAAGVVAP